MNWPASPVGIGPMLRKFKNPFRPNTTKIGPSKRRAIKTAIFTSTSPRELMIRKLSSSGESQDDAEPHSSTVHLFVSLRDLIKRILLDHRMDAAQRTPRRHGS